MLMIHPASAVENCTNQIPTQLYILRMYSLMMRRRVQMVQVVLSSWRKLVAHAAPVHLGIIVHIVGFLARW